MRSWVDFVALELHETTKVSMAIAMQVLAKAEDLLSKRILDLLEVRMKSRLLIAETFYVDVLNPQSALCTGYRKVRLRACLDWLHKCYRQSG